MEEHFAARRRIKEKWFEVHYFQNAFVYGGAYLIMLVKMFLKEVLSR